MQSNAVFIPTMCQAAFFFSSDFQLKPLDLASKISKKLSSVFSVEPSTVNYPPNIPIPLEVPRIILQGDPNGQLTVSPLRADVVFNLRPDYDIELLSKDITSFAECFESTQIVRIGLVLQFSLVGKDVLLTIRDKYIVSEKMKTSTELYIGWVNKIRINNIPSNRLINIACNSSPTNENNTLIVDTNTLPEVVLNLNSVNIKAYVDECLQQYRSNINAFIEW